MLIKLLKYDLMFSRKAFALMACVLIGLAVFVGIVQGTQQEVPFINFSALLFIVILFIIVISCVGQTIAFIRDTFFDDPGYLMLTLPVSRAKQLVSKVIVANLWLNIMMAVGSIAMFIVAMDSASEGFTIVSGLDLRSYIVLFLISSYVFGLVAILFMATTLANSTILGWRVRSFVALVASLAYTAVAIWCLVGLHIRHRHWADESIVRHTLDRYGNVMYTHNYLSHGRIADVGIAIGRIPVGDGYFDIFMWGALMGFSFLALVFTWLMLEKSVSV